MATSRPNPDQRGATNNSGKTSTPPVSKKSSGPPAPPPPPPAQSKNLSSGTAFNQFINAHPSMRPYADSIWKWSKTYGTDPVVMAALYWRESFAQAKASNQDPATIESPTKAGVGIGQINPVHVGEKTPWGATVSQSDLTNPAFNIRWSTWYFSKQESKYGDADTAYSQGYNPGYTGPALSTLLPKNYVPRSGLSPTDKASVSVETTTDKKAITDPWVVQTKSGFKYVNSTQPPKNTITYGGTPITRSEFNQVWTQTYSDTFEAYTGRKATAKEIVNILGTAPSVYSLSNSLATQSGFDKSPVYKQHAPGLIAVAQTILGTGWEPSGGIIRQAIAQNWDQATFEQHVRQLPAYQQGPEFKTNAAQNQAQFESIYGNVDTNTKQLIDHVTLQGWTPDEFASWLRQQPAYKQSDEYMAKQQSFLSALGLVTGAVPTLTGDQVDQAIAAGGQLKAPAAPVTPPPTTPVSPKGSPGTTAANPVDKPTGKGATGYGAVRIK